jgi:hypothetical protein
MRLKMESIITSVRSEMRSYCSMGLGAARRPSDADVNYHIGIRQTTQKEQLPDLDLSRLARLAAIVSQGINARSGLSKAKAFANRAFLPTCQFVGRYWLICVVASCTWQMHYANDTCSLAWP